MLGTLVSAGFGLGMLMGNPRRHHKRRRRNPHGDGFGQKIVFEDGQVRILHTVTTNGSAYYVVDRDTSGAYQTTTAVAVSKHSPLMPAAPYISKEGPPWKRAVKGWLAFLRQKNNPRHRRNTPISKVDARSMRHVLKKHGYRCNPGAIDSHGADELALYITNDGDLYRQNIKFVIANLAKKVKKGKYDATKALKLWGYSADWGAQKYTKEFGGSGNGSFGSFNKPTRMAAAAQLAEHYEDELREAAGVKTNPGSNYRARLDKLNDQLARLSYRSGSMTPAQLRKAKKAYNRVLKKQQAEARRLGFKNLFATNPR